MGVSVQGFLHVPLPFSSLLLNFKPYFKAIGFLPGQADRVRDKYQPAMWKTAATRKFGSLIAFNA
jgi:hypothetical protein